MSQADVNAGIIETLNAINEVAKSQAGHFVAIVDKMVEQADLMLAISERLEVAVDLITAHVDNHAAPYPPDERGDEAAQG